MSWSPDLYIGELRPWPDSVHVVRGNSGEARRYTPERKDAQEALCARIDELCAEVERLRAANAAFTGRSIRAGDKMACLEAENAKLREERREYQVTIDSLVDECTDHKDENAMLRELTSELYQQVLHDDAAWHDVRAWEDSLPSDCLHPIRSYDDSLGKHAVAPKFEKRMRELGLEADDG